MINIVGAGGFAREFLLHWLAANKFPNSQREVLDPFQVNFYVDEDMVLTTIKSLEAFRKPEKMIFVVKPLQDHIKIGNAYIAVGNPALKKRFAKYVINTTGFINPKQSYYPIPEHGSLSNGQIICPGVAVTSNVALDRQVTLNLNVTVGHDTQIDKYVTIHPGANISGNVIISESCIIGSGAVIKEGVYIAHNSVIGAGAVVVKSILEPGGVWVGAPARRIK